MSGSLKHRATGSQSCFTTYIVEAQRPTSNSQGRLWHMTRNALGRGLGALIREAEPQVTEAEAGGEAAQIHAAPPAAGPQQIDIDLIEPSPYQPRTHFR